MKYCLFVATLCNFWLSLYFLFRLLKAQGREDLFQKMTLGIPIFHSYGHRTQCQVFVSVRQYCKHYHLFQINFKDTRWLCFLRNNLFCVTILMMWFIYSHITIARKLWSYCCFSCCFFHVEIKSLKQEHFFNFFNFILSEKNT